jgi:hypothetical protein
MMVILMRRLLIVRNLVKMRKRRQIMTRFASVRNASLIQKFQRGVAWITLACASKMQERFVTFTYPYKLM